MSQNAHVTRAAKNLAEELPIAFKEIAQQDPILAISLKSQHDLIEDGLFAEALKINEQIVKRLELLTMREAVKQGR